MAIRIHLFFSCAVVFILVLNNANTYSLNSPASNYSISNFSWDDCGGSDAHLHFHSFSLSPYPLRIPGHIRMNAVVSLKTELPSDLEVELTVEIKFIDSYIKLPCISDLGSCMYHDACERWRKICPKDSGENHIPCSCPIPPNTYTVDNIPIFINATHESAYSGDYRITGHISSHSRGHIGCVHFRASIIDKDY